MSETIPDTGKLQFNGTGTSGVPQSIQADFEFFDKGHILLVKNFISYSKDLIDITEKLNKWSDCTLANSPNNVYKDPLVRSSKYIYIAGSVHEDLKPYEAKLLDSFHISIKLYLKRNRYAKVQSDTGYEVLKYDVGCQFGEHVDVIPGHAQWGYRRISGVAFLNDNFTGGELVMPHQELSFKPPAGSIILFPSDFSYPHASLPIKTGTKYSCVTWFT